MPLLTTRPPGYRALRRCRFSERGGVYLVTFTTHRRRALFVDFAVASRMCRDLVDGQSWGDTRLLAWVLMPDHWHGLVELGAGDTLARVVNRVKSHSARRVRAELNLAERIWADGFHDRAMRREDDLRVAARYIVLNPVRAGIVDRVMDYPYWDAVWV